MKKHLFTDIKLSTCHYLEAFENVIEKRELNGEEGSYLTGVCCSHQAGSLEDVAKSTPSSITSSDPSTSDDHLQQPNCHANSCTTASSTTTTTPSSTTENEETE